MKTKQLTIESLELDSAIEKRVSDTDAALKSLAERVAKHFATQQRPQPLAVGDSLDHYTGELKAGYEKLNAEVRQHLQPNANFPEGKIDIDRYREKDAAVGKQLADLERRNRDDAFELADFNPATVYARLRLALIATAVVTVGEVLFNTKAFQVTGDTLLSALVQSVCVSFAVFVFSHGAPLLYKAARTPLQRAVVLAGSLALVTGLFTALAVLRSTYFGLHGVAVSPVYFVIVNLFFFVVSGLFSFFVLPTWDEVKRNAHLIKIYLAVKTRNGQIERLEKEREALRDVITERTKERIRIVHLSNHYAERIRAMYAEAIAVFKRVNLAHRQDGKVPDCFDTVVAADIPGIEVNTVPDNPKLS